MDGLMSLNDAVQKNTSVYLPDQDERDFIQKVYNDFVFDLGIKNQNWQVLNNRTLEQFWADSNRDYNVLVEDDPNDPVQQYASGVTRDKSNAFISNLSLQFLSPSVTALNDAKEVDSTVSRLGRPILNWQHSNDGRPAESGELKNFRYLHTKVVEGTVHIQDDIDPETGKLCSQIIPNEEVFIPNFYQPNVQLQGHFLRVQMDTSYQEAKEEFGDLPNFDFVMPGTLGWINQTFLFKERYKAVVSQNRVTIVRLWYPVSSKDLKRLKAEGKLPKKVKQAKWFNVLINGILMFPVDNLMPYYHGNYPVSKGVFELFSPSIFYWGNSQPNKARYDKKFLDGWKTLIRYKAKLGAIPSMVNATGQHIDANIFIPGQVTDLPAGTDIQKGLTALPGISNGITTGDIAILRDTNEDLDRETAAPQTTGQQSSGGKQTAREIMIIEENAQKAMMGIAQQWAWLQEARAFPILKASFQFLTRQEISKLAIPDQTFEDGTTGTMEIVFKKMPKMTDEERLNSSFAIADEELKSKERGQIKQITHVDPEYINNLDFYCKATAESLPRTSNAMREARAQMKWETYSAQPQIFNVKKAARKLAKELGDTDDMVVEQAPVEPQMNPMTPNAPTNQTPNTNLMQNMAKRQTANINTNI